MRRTMIATVALLAAAALGGQALADGSEPANRAKKKVTADNFDFSPKKTSISAGTKVVWTATKGTHTVTFKGGFDETISAGGTASTSRKFKSPGTYKYVCTPHKDQGMKGKVVVG